MANPLVVVVHGVPAPQGSKRHVGNGVLVESSRAVKPWREAVKAAALGELNRLRLDDAPGWVPGRLEPITVAAVFTVVRPASHYRTGRHAEQLRTTAPLEPVGRPDVDKLIRSTFDALTDAGALVDDARVVDVHAVKCYPGGNLDALDAPGAVITVWAG